MPTLADTAVLAEAIQTIGDVRLVIVDPISAYLGGTDSHKNAELRALLSPLAKLAGVYGVAVLGVSHLNKSAGAAIYRTMGSLAFTAAARAVWAVTKDSDDEARRLLLPVKNNLGPDTGGLAYRIQAQAHAAIIEWEPDPVHVDVSEALVHAVRDEERSGRDEAAEWLTDVLRDRPVAVKELRKESTAAGFSWRTIERAKRAAGAIAIKADFSAGWRWTLREDRQDRHDPLHTNGAGGLRQNPHHKANSDAAFSEGRHVSESGRDGGGLGAWAAPDYTIIPRGNGHDYDDAEVF